jgi:acetyl-CoA acyltransferase
MSNKPVYIVSAVRTAIGKAPSGMFKNTRPDDLLAAVLKEAAAPIDPHLIDDVIVGCAMPEGEQGMNVARIATLLAGLPVETPAVTVNRFCSSGLQSIAMAAERIQSGQADVIIAAGVESMSMVKFRPDRMKPSLRYFEDPFIPLNYGMGITAEIVAERWKISRQMQDTFAFESHQKALAGIKSGEGSLGILPYTVSENYPNLATGLIDTKTKIAAVDEGPRADTTLEKLAKLKPVFKNKGTVTAGNSSQMSDGAAALLLVSEDILNQYGLTPLAELKSFAVAGVPPEVMGIGPMVAIPRALEMAGLGLEDMQWIELNEAFAAQALAVIQELNSDTTIINPVGGAIALGHPLGATGAVKSTMMIHGMRARKQKYGMVTMCIGTGMGACGVFEIF